MTQDEIKKLALEAGLKITGKDKHGKLTLRGDDQSWKTFDDLMANDQEDLDYYDSLRNN